MKSVRESLRTHTRVCVCGVNLLLCVSLHVCMEGGGFLSEDTSVPCLRPRAF